MNLHEYQAKIILSRYGLPVLPGFVCYTPGEAEAAADSLRVGENGRSCVVKAQVQAGGRGKAGGIKVAKSSLEARQWAERILGMNLVTPQTGPAGKLVRKVYVEAGCSIASEMYLALLVDRSRGCISFVCSTEGGMEIEQVAQSQPQKICTVPVDPAVGLMPYQVRSIAAALRLESSRHPLLLELIGNLYRAFLDHDFSLLEINPLVLTAGGDFILLDAKCSVDDNSLYRHADLRSMCDYDEQDPRDLQAGKFGLSYVGLDGNIGCMVNGAGLAMATMDIIKHFGGQPANFLDVGGGASKETVTEAFKILLSDSKVKAVLVNIFGGIMRCDVIAAGIVAAAKEVALKVPLVVRLQGTNVELGRKVLCESGLKVIAAQSMAEAGKLVVEAARS